MNRQFMKSKIWMKPTTNNLEFSPFAENNHVGHYQQQITYTAHRFFLDKNIDSPEEYRDVIQVLLSAQEGEIVEFVISSSGGVLESAMNIVSAIRETNATVRAILSGSCHSAASVIALACDEVIVFDYANMLCHSATFGSFGKTTEITSHVKFLEKYLENIASDAYSGFMSDLEIKQMLEGKDFWFDAEDIRTRLEKRSEIQEKEHKKVIRELKKKSKEVDAAIKEKSTKPIDNLEKTAIISKT